MNDTITMYRPIGPREFELLKESGFREWPPRLEGQPLFYPVTNERYAEEITRKWNVADYGIGYVTRFRVAVGFASKFEVKQVGAEYHTEWWIPAEDLRELNDNIIGPIEVIGVFRD